VNNGKLWTVVNPTVGIPLFLGGVITVSLVVHFAVLTNTTWYPAFFGG
jgi:light-harvesting protein B-800-850 alpha chain